MRTDVSKLLLIFGAGLFAFFAQGVLYRDFLWVFEGSEISTGLFLGLWLLWICAGAALAGLFKKIPAFLAGRFHIAVFAYVPAMLLQQTLVLNVRSLAGVARFETFPFGKLLLWTALANAPVSVLTGLLFVAGCLWLKSEGVPAVRVYAAECLGSCVGAVASTLMLAFGFGDFRCLLCASLTLAGLSLASAAKAEGKRWLLPEGVFALSLALLLAGFDKSLDNSLDLRQWRSVVPDGAFEGSFFTKQAKYLYGKRAGQTIVMSWGSVCENIPGLEQAAEPAAISLAQNPEAKKILVCGDNSLSICLRLADFGEVSEIFWASFDPEYPVKLKSAIPEAFSSEASKKIRTSPLDLRRLLETEKGFDLAVISSVNLSSLIATRYCTKEFFSVIRSSLKDAGVMAVSFPGGDSYLGPELAQIGSSFLATVSAVFPKTAFKPGDTSTFFASVKGSPSDNPDELSRRLKLIPGVAKAYPPENVYSAFQPERIRFQLDVYKSVAGSDMVNSDSHPKSFAFSLLMNARKMGLNLPKDAERFLSLALAFALLMAVFHCFARLVWRIGGGLRRGGETEFSRLDLKALIFVAAFSTMALSVALMFKHQVANGSLSIDFGLLNACFMLGSFTGALCAGAFSAKERLFRDLLLVCVLLFGCAAGNIMRLPGPAYPPMLAVGFVGGALVSAATAALRRLGEGELKSGASLETLDCLGGALGGAMASLFFMPAAGLSSTAEVSGAVLAMMSLPLTFSFVFQGRPERKPFVRRVCAALSLAVWLALPLLAALLFILKAGEGSGEGSQGFNQVSPPPPPLKELRSLDAAPLAGTAATAPETPKSASPEDVPPVGKPQEIDAKKIEALIKEGRLSGKKAMHWSSACSEDP